MWRMALVSKISFFGRPRGRGEVCVEFTVPDYTYLEGRLRIRDVVAYLKEVLPPLAQASVSHAAFEAFPLESGAVLNRKQCGEYQVWESAGMRNMVDSRFLQAATRQQ